MNDTPKPENVHHLHESEAAETNEENTAPINEGDTTSPESPEASVAAQGNPGAATGGDVDALRIELEQTKEQMLRALADAENTRRRAQKDRQDASNFAISNFAKDLLDFSDNFGRALASIPEELKDGDERIKSVISGIEAMEKELLRTFEKHGIQKIEPEEEIFDPNIHEVMFEVPGSGKPAGTIMQVLEPGYILKDRLLRPARVGVAKDDGSHEGGPQDSGINIDQEV